MLTRESLERKAKDTGDLYDIPESLLATFALEAAIEAVSAAMQMQGYGRIQYIAHLRAELAKEKR